MRHRRHRPENPVVRYMSARLHRRFFVAFAGAIILAMVVASGVVGFLGGGVSWREQAARAAVFTERRFDEVWDDVPRRDALAREMARDLNLYVTVRDPRGASATWTPEGPAAPKACPRPIYRAPVRGGEVVVCAARPFGGLRTVLGPLLAAALVLWVFAGKLARRMTRPITELVDVVDAIGQGQLDRRAQLPPHRAGELGALARSVNTMAERIERQVEQQRELLAVVSHEIRSPLARMRFLLEALRDAPGPDPRSVDELEREMEGVDALVGDLLANSRMDFGALRKVPLDLAALCRRAAERAGLDADALHLDAEGAVDGDATLLACAVDNLLNNARKHGQAVRALRLTGTADALTVSVDDAGPGFAPDTLQRAFEPFYRGGEARRAQRPGVGLGLALVRRIAEVHGGTASAENLEGGGARVSLRIPRASGA